MRLSDQNMLIAARLRRIIHRETDIISDGEGVAMVLLWGFLADHSRAHNIDIESLAREQLEAFIAHARQNIKIVREH